MKKIGLNNLLQATREKPLFGFSFGWLPRAPEQGR